MEDNLAFCTKKCHEVFTKEPKLHWGNGGKNGTEDPVISKFILVKCLATDGNVAKYRGGLGNSDKKKIELQAIIETLINSKGVKVRHNANGVKNQVKHIEAQMKVAMVWKDWYMTSAGVQRDDEGQLENTLLWLCLHLHDL